MPWPRPQKVFIRPVLRTIPLLWSQSHVKTEKVARFVDVGEKILSCSSGAGYPRYTLIPIQEKKLELNMMEMLSTKNIAGFFCVK